jgi:hypothetical protein
VFPKEIQRDERFPPPPKVVTIYSNGLKHFLSKNEMPVDREQSQKSKKGRD